MHRIITDISLINPQQWDELARTVRTASWFQTREAVGFFSQLPGELRAVVCAVEEDGVLQGVVVAYVSWNGGPIGRLFTNRAIIEGGPMLRENISSQTLEQLLTTLRDILSEQAIYTEIRNFENFSRWRAVFERCGFTYEPHYNFHVSTTSSLLIEERLSKSRRRNISAAKRAGLRTIDAPSPAQVREFYQILRSLYVKKVRTPLWSVGFFEKLLEQKNAHFLLAEYEGKIVSGTVCVCLSGRRLYEWYVCGDDERYRELFPSSYATYSAICYANQQGCERFDMMGAGTPDEPSGVRDFKARFGGELVEYGRYRIINKPFRYKLGVLGVKLLKMI